MFNLGIQAEKIFHKPYIAMLKENNVRKGFFEHGEFIAFRDALPDYLKPVATFDYFTGWRKKEILSLTWNQVDLSAKTVRLEVGETKSDKGRIIVLDGELLETIEAQWERRKVAEIPGQSPTLLCLYVFHKNGKPIGDIRDAWNKARKTTGLKEKIPHNLGARRLETWSAPACLSVWRWRSAGTKPRSVFDRYNIVSEADLKEAARKTSEHAQNQSKASNVVVLKQG